MEDWQKGGFGLYLHWPFCQAKCPYCDFNSHVAAFDPAAWRDAYLAEIARAGADTPGRVLQTVYFGGGTPSLMPVGLVADLIAAVRATWPMVNDPEITLEANPTSVEAGWLRGYRAAGVNRVSMGIQALNDDDLRALGRLHSVDEALAALTLARDVFDRVSFDLIYARQNQIMPEWRDELHRALTLGPDHLSMYQLTIEPGTAFGDRFARGKLPGLPSDDAGADMYEATQEICEAAGLPAYEVSNHARPGAESRHNLIYWRGGDYVGIGPGAHGRLTLDGVCHATETHLSPTLWLDAVATHGTGESRRTALPGIDRAEEYLMMSLRLSEGMDSARFAALAGQPLEAGTVAALVADGWLHETGTRLVATARGRLVLNQVVQQLLVTRE